MNVTYETRARLALTSLYPQTGSVQLQNVGQLSGLAASNTNLSDCLRGRYRKCRGACLIIACWLGVGRLRPPGVIT